MLGSDPEFPGSNLSSIKEENVLIGKMVGPEILRKKFLARIEALEPKATNTFKFDQDEEKEGFIRFLKEITLYKQSLIEDIKKLQFALSKVHIQASNAEFNKLLKSLDFKKNKLSFFPS